MTGVILKAPAGADFSGSAIGWDAGVNAGLAYANFYGATAAKNVRNLAVGGPTPKIVGAPTQNANSVVLLDAANYIDTGVSQTADLTALVVFKATADGGSSMVLGNYKSPRLNDTVQSSGYSVYTVPGSNTTDNIVSVRLNASEYSGVAGDASAALTLEASGREPVGVFKAFAARCRSADKVRTVFDLGVGDFVTVTGTQTIDVAAGTIRIGSSYGVAGPFPNTCEVAFAGIWNVALTDAQIQTVYARVKAVMASAGIAV
ncbi:MAG TPA: hypothetical protein VGJ10_03320 [Paraburkholderia sp.]|jgi:hypothetical protein